MYPYIFMQKTLLILLLFLAFASCKKTAEQDIEIYGQWQWKYSTGGYYGTDTTRPNPGSTVILTFKKDMTYTSELNSQIVCSGKFVIAPLSGGERLVQVYNFVVTDRFSLDYNGAKIKFVNGKLQLTNFAVASPSTHFFY
jgi:hypothetical protein